MVITVAGCVAQAEGDEIVRRAPSVDLVVGPQSYHHLPGASPLETRREPVAASRQHFPTRTSSSALPRADAAGEVSCPRLFSYRAGRLRQVLHVLRRALYPRHGIFAARRVDHRRGAAARRERRARDHAARPERQRLSRRGPRRREGDHARGSHPPSREPSMGSRACGTSTSHPRDMSDDLIQAHADEEKLMPFLHLPFQAGADRVLAAMNRKHTAAEYVDLIGRDLARRGPISRSRPTSSSAFRARRTRISRRRSRWSHDVGFAHALTRSSTARGRARRPRPWTSRCRKP